VQIRCWRVHASFSFDGSPADFHFRSDIARLNLSKLEAGESFGNTNGSDARLVVLPGDGYDSTDVYFDYRDGEIGLTQEVIPAMLTQDLMRSVRIASATSCIASVWKVGGCSSCGS
jgi:hypothetical protein